MKPFVKWAGGKRWLVEREEFRLPSYTGRYIEPFLGGGAVFFHHQPKNALLADLNPRLIEAYLTIRSDWASVWELLLDHQRQHSAAHYYKVRGAAYEAASHRAAQFLYLNRACWNGLYRENQQGQFNVPIGTKKLVVFQTDNFRAVSELLQNVELQCADFEKTISAAQEGDLLFVDPPYTTAHNFNGFVKYNQKIFDWADQVRLRDALVSASQRGVRVVLTNADHESVASLYEPASELRQIQRHTVISGKTRGRRPTSELLIYL